MKCSICGGELSFTNNMGVCSNCGNTHSIESVFENTDVCICYTEYDENGKRTKDSIISSEIYKRLEAKNVNTFYERVSVADVGGEDIEPLRYAAIFRAKIILLVGTTEERFSTLYDKFKSELADKKIIPIISDMKPEQLPEALRRYQALNFDSVGALNDLLTSILNFLGYDDKFELDEIYKKKAKKKKILVASLVSLLAVVISAAVILAVIFWPEKKETSTVTDSDIYNSAIELLDDKKYLEAAEKFSKILDYKDSSNQFKKIYDRYDGYYLDEESNCALYLNIIDGKTADIVFEKTIDKKLVKIEESMVIKNNSFSGKYTDSLNNEGEITVKLTDKEITVKATTNIENGSVSLGETSVSFLVSNKSDRPTTKAVTKDVLLEWISDITYLNDIKAAGYELEYINNSSEYDFFFGYEYKIVNTDISIIVTDYDLNQFKGLYNDSPKLDDKYVIAIMAPAKVICNERIGKEKVVFVDDDIAYFPGVSELNCETLRDGETSIGFNLFFGLPSGIEPDDLVIGGDMKIGVISRSVFGSRYFDKAVNRSETEYMESVVLLCHFEDNPLANESSYSYSISTVTKKDNNVLVLVSDASGSFNSRYNVYTIGYFIYNSQTYTCEYITGFENVKESDLDTLWKEYPEYFGDFMDVVVTTEAPIGEQTTEYVDLTEDFNNENSYEDDFYNEDEYYNNDEFYNDDEYYNNDEFYNEEGYYIDKEVVF